MPESESIEAVRRALGSFQMPNATERNYLWEVVSNDRVQWEDTGSERLFAEVEYLVVFDPNPWNMQARLAIARLAMCDEAPLAYRCTSEEAKKLFSQPWISNADFYLLSMDGRFFGMRTHEDTGPDGGMWIPKT